MSNMSPDDQKAFAADIKDLHLLYDYDAHDAQGNPEKWRYEMWFFSADRIVYAIHGGPMAVRYPVYYIAERWHAAIAHI